MTLEGNKEGDTAKSKMGTNTLNGNIHGMVNKQTHITFCGNKSLKCLIWYTVKSFKQQFLQRTSCSNSPILADYHNQI